MEPPDPPPHPTDKALAKLEQKLKSWSSTNPLAQKSITLYENHKRFLPATFFLGGVAWDGATLKRIDAWVDTFILLTYLLLLGALIVVAQLTHHKRISHPVLEKYKQWFAPAIQFFLGALFSAYFIFYLQSASFRSGSIIFILFLAGMLIANEFMQNRLANTNLLFTLYFFVCVSFFAFFIPILTKTTGYGVFLVSCLLGLAITGGMLQFLNRKSIHHTSIPIKKPLSIILALFVLLNGFYLLNWIPPVPLSMKEGNIYRDVTRVDDTYQLRYAEPPWYKFWVASDRTYYHADGDTVFCFSAVFAPNELKSAIFHEWQYYDEQNDSWAQSDLIPVNISGGRDGGYRTYTRKKHVKPGRWRVNIKTERQQVLGRIPFTIVPVDSAVTSFAYTYYK